MSEHRTGKRFPLELPIKFIKKPKPASTPAMTGNLSAAGVYIKADAALEVGSNVEFEIALPPEDDRRKRQRNHSMPRPGRTHR